MHRRPRFAGLVAGFAAALAVLAIGLPAAAAGPRVSFAIVKTGRTVVQESLLYAGGDKAAKLDNNFSAFLIRHGDDEFLFDTGLGARIDSQYAQDMPGWKQRFFKYLKPIIPARDQLARAGLPPIRRVILSHSHWDHASGVVDFPQAEVWVTKEELAFIRGGGAWPSQVGAPSIRWRTILFQPRPYRGFAQSLDLYGDGTVVLVPQFGHTPGAVGMFVTTSSGRRFFFCGDTVWSAAAIPQARPKFWLAGLLADSDAGRTQAEIDRMRALQKADPGLTIVPAHDSRVQARLGFFPNWVE
ncbi:glyoxylase-like metal-dependent hydrolase (beta-lactamase superfamily II) [Caulobacter ginsengisoli]|uniref:Glyoxylase-like metal-dependent hydrolase (Beta-lactamase superfamily II) n=1 Tax=Caulobacter ginsengisoli TaxID=400775 RepID=A0ABU0IZL6_9CAUL|nr:MBL fold metallo-hydrolase [Caulobacter ginsengisoli]MDQ0466741.1 glyoxylase-like metal-dependent hydrolase (beta-lactamase superfamily II) [Caulobacter ginsengisoli]